MKASILCSLTDMVGTCNLLQRARLPHSCQLTLGTCASDESITTGLSSFLEKHLWFLPHVVSLHGKGFQPGSSVMNHSPKQWSDSSRTKLGLQLFANLLMAEEAACVPGLQCLSMSRCCV